MTYTKSANGRTYWFTNAHTLYAITDEETGAPIPVENKPIPSIKLRPKDGKVLLDTTHGDKCCGQSLLQQIVSGRLVDALPHIERLDIHLEFRDGGMGMGAANGVDLPIEQCVHDSSSPLAEGAATPDDASVEGAAGPRPDSPRGADHQGGAA